MAHQTPEQIISERGAALKESIIKGQHYELAADLRELLAAVDTLKVRTPSPEGWLQTAHRPHPGPTKYHYVFHSQYGVLWAIYESAEWEDKSLWVTDWHGDFEFIRPRFGWAAPDENGNLALLDPQPSHYLPEPQAPSV